MNQLSFQQKGEVIVVVLNGQAAMEIGWAASLEICRALDVQIRNAEARQKDPTILCLPETGIKVGGTELLFRQEFEKILCIANGRLLFDMNTTPTSEGISIARYVWRTWLGVARVVEEESSDPEKLILDAAILHRSGAPFGLSNSPKINAEAKKEATGNRELRRFMPDGIKSAEVLGTPTVKIDTRPPLEQALELVGSLDPESLLTLQAKLLRK